MPRTLQGQGLTLLRRHFSDPISFVCAKRNGVGPPKKSAIPCSTAYHSTTSAVVTGIHPTPCAATAGADKDISSSGPREYA